MMAWKAYKGVWPNGRSYWTVEDRANNAIRIGDKGGVTKYHDRDLAQAEAKRLNDDPPDLSNPRRGADHEPSDDRSMAQRMLDAQLQQATGEPVDDDWLLDSL